MKKMLLASVALGSASPSPARPARQIKIGVAGPLTGPNAAFGAQLKNGAEQAVDDINAAGGINGQKIAARRRRRRLRSQAGRVGRQQVRRRRRQVRRRPLQLRRHHPGLRGLRGKRHRPDHAGRDQPEDHRAQHVEHVPHLRSRRSAGRCGRQLHRRQVQGQEGRHRPRQDHLRQGPRRRDQEGHERKGPEGSALRRRQHRREGLLRARLEDQGRPAPTSSTAAACTPKAA